MNSDTPHIAHCPRCFCTLDIRQSYSVNFCLPVQPPFPPSTPAYQVPTYQHPAIEAAARPSPSQQTSTPAPPYEPPSLSQPQEQDRTTGDDGPVTRDDGPVTRDDGPVTRDDGPATRNGGPATRNDGPATRNEGPVTRNEGPATRNEGRATHNESRRSSMDSAFTEFSIDARFANELTVMGERYLSEQQLQADSSSSPPTSPPPPSTSPPPPPTSSPSTVSSVTLSSMVTSSPPMEALSIPSGSSELRPTMRRWVVFRGCVPGIYSSSTEATDQTDGFRRAFMMAYDDPTAANTAYEQFQEFGTIPAHGRGPWVVFMGCQPGVFTSYEELCALRSPKGFVLYIELSSRYTI